MTREKSRDLDKLSMVYCTALWGRDFRTLALLWAAADYDTDLEDMLYDLAYHADMPEEQLWAASKPI